MGVSHNLPQLPLEVYTDAFTDLFSFGQDIGLKTLLSLLATNRHIRTAASHNVIWRPYYRARYTHSVWTHEKWRHAHYHGDYRLQYFARRTRDKQGLRLLDDIRTQVLGRGPRARKLVNEFSFDVWDALRSERLLPVPEFFRQPWEGPGPAVPNAFPRRYWAGVAQGIIARSWAVRMWRGVASGDPSVSFEDMIAGFSAFHEWSPAEIYLELHRASEMCGKVLVERGVHLNQKHPDFNLYQVCWEVIYFMKVSGWMTNDDAINAESSRPYLKSFPHHFLRNAAQHGSLTVLSKSWLFTGICRRLGFDAFPTRLLSKETICCVRSSDVALGPVVVNFGQGERLISGGVPCENHDGTSLLTEGEVMQSFVPLHPCEFIDEVRRDFIGNINRWYPSDANALLPGHNVSADEQLRVVHAIGCFLTATHNMASDWGENPSLFLMGPITEALPLDGGAVILNALFPTDGQVPPACSVPVAELHDALRRAEDVNTSLMRRARPPHGASRHSVGEIVYESVTKQYGCITGWQHGPETSKATTTDCGERSTQFYVTLPPHYFQRVTEPSALKSAILTKGAAWNLRRSWPHFGRYFEDVSTDAMAEDERGDMLPTRLMLTAEMQVWG